MTAFALLLALIGVIFFLPLPAISWVRANAGRLLGRVFVKARVSAASRETPVSADPTPIARASEVRPNGRNSPIKWGEAAKNIVAAFAKAFAFILKNPVLIWVLIVFAGYLMIVGLRSPFDLFGPSKAELRAELRQAEAALKLTREAGDIALEEGERFRADVHNLSQRLDQGRDAIHAASTHETRDLFLAWAAADRGLCASAGGC